MGPVMVETRGGRDDLGIAVVRLGRDLGEPVALVLPERLATHELILVLEGSGSVEVDRTEHACGPGTVLLVRPGQVQRVSTVSDGRPKWREAIAVRFAGSFPRSVSISLPDVADEAFGARRWNLTGRELETVGAGFACLAEEYARVGDDASGTSVELLRLTLTSVLLRLTRVRSEETGAGSLSPGYHAFRRELERSYATVHTTRAYADRLGFSPRALNEVCRAAAGHTAKELIDARIVLEAQRLLADTDLPVAAIGRRLGYDEATNFGKFFLRCTGTTPGEFRRRLAPR